MQLEAVRGVAVGDLRLQICRQIDNRDGAERTFLRADTATDTEAFRNEGDLGASVDFDAELAGTDDGARFLAFLTTFLAPSQFPIPKLVF